MPSSPLNVFQRVIRQWERVHPYNAAQIMKLRGTPDLAKLEDCWRRAVTSLGIGPATVRFGRYSFDPSANGRVLLVPARRPTLEEHVTEQMNLPFLPGEPPVRPFVIPEPDADAYYAGAVYQHWIADSVAMQMLMRQWLLLVHDAPRWRGAAVRLPRGGYWRYFGSGDGRWQFSRGLGEMTRDFFRFRRVRKLHTGGSRDYSMGYMLREAPRGFIDKVREAARHKNVTVNDLFISAIARACANQLPVSAADRRRDLGIGTIVDLRPMASQALDDCFGLFLGFSHVICDEAALSDEQRLLRSIARQTAHNRRTGAAAAAQLWLAAGLTARLFRPVRKFYQYYRKYMPLAAGISNVNMNRTWAAERHPDPLLQYIRVSPTGPMVPVVFTTTTLGDTFHFSLVHRRAIISEAAARSVAQSFLDHLSSLA